MTKDPQTPDPEKAEWDAAFETWAATWPERHRELMSGPEPREAPPSIEGLSVETRWAAGMEEPPDWWHHPSCLCPSCTGGWE